MYKEQILCCATYGLKRITLKYTAFGLVHTNRSVDEREKQVKRVPQRRACSWLTEPGLHWTQPRPEGKYGEEQRKKGDLSGGNRAQMDKRR